MMKMKHTQILIPQACFDGGTKQGLTECRRWRNEKKKLHIEKQSNLAFQRVVDLVFVAGMFIEIEIFVDCRGAMAK